MMENLGDAIICKHCEFVNAFGEKRMLERCIIVSNGIKSCPGLSDKYLRALPEIH